MISRKTGNKVERQRGFALLELTIVMALICLIGTAVGGITFQLLKQSKKNSDFTIASQLTMNAIHWISRDTEMSQSINLGADSGFPLSLSWVDWENNAYMVIYNVEDNILKRSYTVNSEQEIQTVLANSINMVSGNTTCTFSNKILSLRITATVGGGDLAVSVTNKREIFMRSIP